MIKSLDEETEVVTRINYTIDVEFDVFLTDGGKTIHRSSGVLVERTDYHDDGSESVYRYIDIGKDIFDDLIKEAENV